MAGFPATPLIEWVRKANEQPDILLLSLEFLDIAFRAGTHPRITSAILHETRADLESLSVVPKAHMVEKTLVPVGPLDEAQIDLITRAPNNALARLIYAQMLRTLHLNRVAIERGPPLEQLLPAAAPLTRTSGRTSRAADDSDSEDEDGDATMARRRLETLKATTLRTLAGVYAVNKGQKKKYTRQDDISAVLRVVTAERGFLELDRSI